MRDMARPALNGHEKVTAHWHFFPISCLTVTWGFRALCSLTPLSSMGSCSLISGPFNLGLVMRACESSTKPILWQW